MTPAKRIAEATQGSKWENRLWVVGGAVRDELLGLPVPPDVDIVLEGDSLELARFLRQEGVSEIEPVTYPRFGTALVRVEGQQVELVTARRESYEEASRKPTVESATLKDDALRRDFTINTLLKNLHTGEVQDPLGVGLDDLKKRVLRTPLDPAATFSDDPLRMLRAVRFKNRFNLTPAPGLYDAISKERERLRIVSMERVRDELVKMLLHMSAAESLRDLMDLGLLSLFAPEFAEGIGVEQGSYHAKDVWEHTLDVVRVAAARENSGENPQVSEPDISEEEGGEPIAEPERRRLLVLLAALLHDIGKPRTRSVEVERVRFFEHERVGAEITEKVLRRLRFSRQTCLEVSAIVKNHMRLGSAVPFTASAARRLVRDLGPLLEPLLRVCEADAEALRALPKGIDFADVRAKLAQVQSAGQPRGLESPLSGEEIIELLGLEPGPEVGRWKRRLTEAVLEGEVLAGDKAAARELLAKEAMPEGSSNDD